MLWLTGPFVFSFSANPPTDAVPAAMVVAGALGFVLVVGGILAWAPWP